MYLYQEDPLKQQNTQLDTICPIRTNRTTQPPGNKPAIPSTTYFCTAILILSSHLQLHPPSVLIILSFPIKICLHFSFLHAHCMPVYALHLHLLRFRTRRKMYKSCRNFQDSRLPTCDAVSLRFFRVKHERTVNCLTRKTKAPQPLETSGTTHQTKKCHIPQGLFVFSATLL